MVSQFSCNFPQFPRNFSQLDLTPPPPNRNPPPCSVGTVSCRGSGEGAAKMWLSDKTENTVGENAKRAKKGHVSRYTKSSCRSRHCPLRVMSVIHVVRVCC